MKPVWQSLPDAQLYWLHGYQHLLGVWSRARLRRVPLVFDAHDAYFQLVAARDTTPGARAFATLEVQLERLAARRADAVVTVSDGVADLYRERFHTDPVIVRNAHDPRLDRPAARSIREIVGVDEEAILVVVIGNHKVGMAIDSAIEAIHALPAGFHLAFVGRGYSPELASARVHLVDPVPPTQVTSLVEGADVSAVLYRHPAPIDHRLALPNGLYHGLAAGLPVVYPSLPEIQRLCRRWAVGMEADLRDPADVARAIEAAVTRRDELRANVSAARDALTWGAQEPALLDVVDRLVG